MYKSAFVHLKNKYPSCRVSGDDNSLDVFKGNDHLVALRKNGNGQWEDKSEELGCRDRFDLAPIPKHARHFKLHAKGEKCAPSEESSSRKPIARQYEAQYGKVPSLFELAGNDAQKCKDSNWLKQFDDGQPMPGSSPSPSLPAPGSSDNS